MWRGYLHVFWGVLFLQWEGDQARPVAMIEEALPLTIAIDSLCLSQCVSRLSPVTAEIRLPSSDTNLELDLPYTPVVSMASGSNRYWSWRLLYTDLFRSSALFAAMPGANAVSLREVLQ